MTLFIFLSCIVAWFFKAKIFVCFNWSVCFFVRLSSFVHLWSLQPLIVCLPLWLIAVSVLFICTKCFLLFSCLIRLLFFPLVCQFVSMFAFYARFGKWVKWLKWVNNSLLLFRSRQFYDGNSKHSFAENFLIWWKA